MVNRRVCYDRHHSGFLTFNRTGWSMWCSCRMPSHLALCLSLWKSPLLDQSLNHSLLRRLLCETATCDSPSGPGTYQRAHNPADRCCPPSTHTHDSIRTFSRHKVTNYSIISTFQSWFGVSITASTLNNCMNQTLPLSGGAGDKSSPEI